MILLSFEKDLIDKNKEQIDVFLDSAHIDNKKLKKWTEEFSQKIEEYFGKYDLSFLFIPFDKQKFSNHKEKIKFLSKFILYTREILIPLIESISDVDKKINDVIGPYFSKNKLSELKKTTELFMISSI